MEKYLVNTYDNHWVECDSAGSNRKCRGLLLG